ncbi:MAG: single-stranded DNA-binding protein [Tenuifilaceae bacterium]|nr:single-stranded DNA-binding protein [Tenuifilaceae bacterium]
MVNKVILIGRTGKDPEITSLRDGVKVARISLATSEAYTNKAGEKVEQTEWHNLSIWRAGADIAEKYISKGQLLFVEGKLHHSTFEKDGVKHYRTEIVVDKFRMLSGRPAEQTQPIPENSTPEPQGGDDLPF